MTSWQVFLRSSTLVRTSYKYPLYCINFLYNHIRDRTSASISRVFYYSNVVSLIIVMNFMHRLQTCNFTLDDLTIIASTILVSFFSGENVLSHTIKICDDFHSRFSGFAGGKSSTQAQVAPPPPKKKNTKKTKQNKNKCRSL